MPQDPGKTDAFYANARRWRDELAALRQVLLDSPLTEEFKWRSPCYTYQGGNVASVWGLKDACAVAFFKGVLLDDPDGRLVAPGENSRTMRTLRFQSVAEIAAAEPDLKRFIAGAIALEQAGAKVTFAQDDLDWPEELEQRLADDPALKAAFAALTPGRQRGYLLHFSGAKQSASRAARIERNAPRILAGKGLHDR